MTRPASILAALVIFSLPLIAQGGFELEVKDDAGKSVLLYNQSYALVIGVSDYKNGWPKLPGVEKDIDRVAGSLTEHGFKVETVVDPTREELYTAFDSFISRYGEDPENRLLFYFSGHGHTVKQAWGDEMGYIVPIDAPNPHDNESGFRATAMDMQQIEVYAKKIQSKHALFIFDSCFSGSIFALSRAVPQHIGYKTAQPVRQFITSGGADEEVPDKSVFCDQFIEGMKGEADRNQDGYVTGSELGEFLQERVVNYSNASQHPQYGKIRHPRLDKGDFFFKSHSASAGLIPEMPEDVGDFSLAELEKKAAEEEHIRGEWKQYREDAEAAYAEVLSFEKKDVDEEMKAKAWETYVESFSQDDPYSAEDDKMRQEAEKQIKYWRDRRKITRYGESHKRLGNKTVTFEMDFVPIPGGTFEMGSYDGDNNERPVHAVSIQPFAMQATETTVGQFREFIEATGYKTTAERNGWSWMWQGKWSKVEGVYWANPGFPQTDQHPVVHVSWIDVKEYIQWRNRLEPGAGYRLPTEAEWEYAAGNGELHTSYSWGNEDPAEKAGGNIADKTASKRFPNLKIFDAYDDGFLFTAPAASYEASDFGLYDITGNVWEWCEDDYVDSYQSASPDGSAWVATPRRSHRIARGGCWNSSPRGCRITNRFRSAATNHSLNLGFRLVRMGN